jgi:hypothetical protein
MSVEDDVRIDEESLKDITMFFDSIFGEHVGYVTLAYITGRDPKHPRAIDGSVWFEWPKQREALHNFCIRNGDRDLYTSPMLYSSKSRKMEEVSITPVIWMDADQAHPSVFKLEPSIIVETSPDSWHLYWVVDEDMDPTWAAGMARNMAYSHRDVGADDGWQLGKLLRVPGVWNTKPSLPEPWVVKMTMTAALGYDRAALVAAYGEPRSVPRVLQLATAPDMPDAGLPMLGDVLAKLPPSADIARMRNIAPRGDWSDQLFALECSLFRAGLTVAEVFVAVKDCACDKYARDRRPTTDLWADVVKASTVWKTAPAELAHKGPVILTEQNEGTYSPAPAVRPSFLTESELAAVEHADTFINRYVKWATTRTRADPGYHEFSAMCLMSTVLADFGHLTPQFGKMKLNMWFMILGVTTGTYKSTSKNLMEEILDPLNDPDVGYLYKIGGDATPEKLITKLSEMPHRSTLFLRDEISGLFGEIKGGKSYMSGLAETMTELYDGKVRARLRMTGGGKETAETGTAFNVYVCGVPGKVAEIMQPEDFATGFLARFLFVIGEPAVMTKETAFLPQAAPEQGDLTKDLVAKELRKELAVARTYWSRNAAPGDTQRIVVDDDAWARWNDMAWEMSQLARREERADILEPSSNRLSKQVLKLAALLAMIECKSRVNMGHMLIAIQYAEKWYQTMIQMSQMIQTSVWSVKVHKLIDYIRKHKGQVTWPTALRAFMMPSKEFSDLVFGAAEAQLLSIVNNEQGVKMLVVSE